ncbi:MAG TPA: DUF1844 domain-containing protein [Candidatus Polarisedimenticolia bacterium]|nr:DUF1844 domain-containing protein [Candidatus Polarisedimenticolia bacterium]
MPDLPPEDHSSHAPLGPSPREAAVRPRKAPDATTSAPASREEQFAAAQFKNLILNLAHTAAASLRDVANHPGEQIGLYLESARQMIDILASLRHKTRGNLNAEEAGLLDELLADLQMECVNVEAKAAKKS